MKTAYSNVIELGRRFGPFPYISARGDRFGLFEVRGPRGEMMRIVASDGARWSEGGLPLPAWEHVSVSLQRRCPTWEEMCWVKGEFWNDDECVIQFHPPKSDYVNEHRFCLHLWRPVGVAILVPPAVCVGVKPGGAA